MQKILFLILLLNSLVSCSSNDKYEKRSEQINERQEKLVERAIDKAPKWMTQLPESSAAVYANGSAVSRDFSMADEKAKLAALGKICTAAGGEVDKQSKMFLSDTEDTSVERSETAIRSMCRGVDVSGTEIVEVKRIAEGSRFRTYILVSLPLGEANQLATRNEQRRAAAGVKSRSDKAFNEMDANNKR